LKEGFTKIVTVKGFTCHKIVFTVKNPFSLSIKICFVPFLAQERKCILFEYYDHSPASTYMIVILNVLSSD